MTNLVVWLYNRKEPNFINSPGFRQNSVFLKDLDRSNIDYCIKEVDKDVLNSDDFNIFPLELLSTRRYIDVLDTINNINFLKKCKVVIWYPREGHILDGWFQDLDNFCYDNDLESYFVYSDVDIESAITKKIKPIFINYFLSEYFYTVQELNHENIIIDLEAKKEKDFLCYNGKYRPSRLKLVSDLYKNNLQDNYISFNGGHRSSKTLKECLEFFTSRGLKDDYLEEFVKNFKPIYLDKEDSKSLEMVSQNTINVDHYSKTYFSIVTETTLNTVFLTEKIYKPILNHHPFILVGSDGFLRYLEKLGFYTFEDFFDQPYDHIENDFERYTIILNNIKSFCSLSDEEKQKKFNSVKSNLVHNRNHYIKLAKQAQEYDIKNILGKIYES